MRPRHVSPELPRDLEAICLKCLEKEPDRRYQTAEAMASDLRHFLAGEPVRVRPLSAPRRMWRWCRRRPAPAALSLVTFLLLGYVVAASVAYSVRTSGLLHDARTNLYFHRIIAAQQSWRDNDMEYLRVLLDDCPAELRQWEWGYLRDLPASAKKRLEGAGGWVTYSPDGSRIATAGFEKAVKIWDADAGRMLFAFRGYPTFPPAAAFSADGLRLASANGDDKTAVVWDLQQRQKVATCRGHQGAVVGVKFSPDGRRLLTASGDRTVRVWEVATGREVHRLEHPGRVWCADVTPNGKLLASVSGRDEFSWIQVWDAESGKRVWHVPGSGRQADLAFSPDGRRLAVADSLDNVRVFAVESGNVVLVIPTCTGLRPHVAYSPDGSLIAVNQWDNSVTIWDAVRGVERGAIRGQTAHVQSLAFRPGSSEIAFGTARDIVFVHDTAKEAGVITLRGHKGEVPSLDFSPDGATLVSAGQDGTLRAWDAERGGESRLLGGDLSPTRCVVFSPTGQILAAGSDDSTVRIWDAASQQCILAFQGHAKAVQALDFAPDGTRIASAGRDRTIKVWEAATGRVLQSLPTDERDIHSVAFSPCGRYVASVRRDGSIVVWKSATGVVKTDPTQETRPAADDSCERTISTPRRCPARQSYLASVSREPADTDRKSSEQGHAHRNPALAGHCLAQRACLCPGGGTGRSLR